MVDDLFEGALASLDQSNAGVQQTSNPAPAPAPAPTPAAQGHKRVSKNPYAGLFGNHGSSEDDDISSAGGDNSLESLKQRYAAAAHKTHQALGPGTIPDALHE